MWRGGRGRDTHDDLCTIILAMNVEDRENVRILGIAKTAEPFATSADG